MKKMFLVLAMLVLSIVCNEQKGTFLEEKKEKVEAPTVKAPAKKPATKKKSTTGKKTSSIKTK